MITDTPMIESVSYCAEWRTRLGRLFQRHGLRAVSLRFRRFRRRWCVVLRSRLGVIGFFRRLGRGRRRTGSASRRPPAVDLGQHTLAVDAGRSNVDEIAPNLE